MFENLAEGGKLDLTNFISFWKIWKKSAKFRKIWLKHTGDDGGTVKTGKTKIRLVLLINQPVFPENWREDFWANFARNRAIFAENW
jgi:hypothetical protein